VLNETVAGADGKTLAEVNGRRKVKQHPRSRVFDTMMKDASLPETSP
jgi:hypothetical protein